MDLMSKNKSGNKITDINYNYYYYGPYSSEIIDRVEELKEEDSILESKVEGQTGRNYFLYTTTKPINQLDSSFTSEEVETINGVISEYGPMNFKQLIENVYATEPISKNPQGTSNIL